MARAIDVVQVKAEIAAEKLAVIIENGSVLLKDMQSGEAVKIATLTPPNEPLICDGCLWAEMGALEKCSSCMRDKKDNYYRRPQEGEEKTHDERTENPGHERRGVADIFLRADFCKCCEHEKDGVCNYICAYPNIPLYEGCKQAALKWMKQPAVEYT